MLEAIGTISKTDRDKAARTNYQDTVTEPVARARDGEAALLEDDEEDIDELLIETDNYKGVVSAVRKVCDFLTTCTESKAYRIIAS